MKPISYCIAISEKYFETSFLVYFVTFLEVYYTTIFIESKLPPRLQIQIVHMVVQPELFMVQMR